MFFIFGWGNLHQSNYGDVIEVYCDHCNNLKYHQLIKERTWFNLFFIPAIPYKTEYFLTCPICNTGEQLKYTNFKMLKNIAGFNQAYMRGEVSQEEFEKTHKQLQQEIITLGN